MTITVEELQALLVEHDDGVLKRGSHSKHEGAFCALELLSIAKKIPFTDKPAEVGSWDIRYINDMQVDDKVRTKYLLPVLSAYCESRSWPIEKQMAVSTKIVILTVNRLIAELPGLPEDCQKQCKQATTLDDAKKAATAATACTAEAADAAYAAADAAAAAAYAAAKAATAAYAADTAATAAYAAAAASATERVFITACELWLEACNVCS